MKTAITLLVSLLVTALSPLQAAPVPAGVKVLKDLEYVKGGHERQKLDLYLPEKADKPLPVIVWVHGGGWNAGSKANPTALPFVQKGYAVASINYRLSQHAIFPAQIHDCKAAVRWLRAHAAEYGLDKARFAAWGSSAGGHLVALMATTDGIKELEGDGGHADQPSGVQAVVDWFGPTDFFTAGEKNTRTQLIGGSPETHREQAKKAGPMTYVSKNATPILVMHGDKDVTVVMSQSETFVQALKAAGADATFVKVEGAAHGAGGFAKRPEVMKQVEDFLAKHLKAGR